MVADPTSLTDRLARLRALDSRLLSAAELPARPPRTRPASPEPRTLAAALGGRVESTADAELVVVDRDLEIPFDPGPLRDLPYPVDPSCPLVLLDTETTGLGTGAGTVAFLIGLAWWSGPRFRVRQLWLPDHPHERGLLQALAANLPERAWLVTYNGRSFDWPLLVARYRIHGQAPPPLAGHLDLLPVARGLWRHRLPDARLASVEAGVAGIRRPSDLPGALVPERYTRWLMTGDPGGLAAVADHNRQDVVSLACLLGELAGRLAVPERRSTVHPGDVAGLGRAFRRSGRLAEAIACLEAAIEGAENRSDRASRALDPAVLGLERARLLVRAGRLDEARAAWQSATVGGGRAAIEAWICLAKDFEHRRGDLVAAGAATERARGLLARRRALGLFMPEAERDLAHRLRRLERRLARSRGRAKRPDYTAAPPIPTAREAPACTSTNSTRATATSSPTLSWPMRPSTTRRSS
ncbi:MAG TPA: ribonuclease H-like domain-containing protein [Candidatus Limnocylindrales bacterium]|nr:ribonuclease H-like domain-containing protein [Candidatus Limnocylindrales bacterium]